MDILKELEYNKGYFPEKVDMFLEDLLTEGMGNILAFVFNGDLNLLYDVIEDDSLCIYARGAASNALIVLAVHGVVDRKDVLTYYKKLLRKLIDKKDEGIKRKNC